MMGSGGFWDTFFYTPFAPGGDGRNWFTGGGVKAPKPERPRIDNAPTPRSARGSRIPLVIGRMIVAPVVLWAGDRREVENDVSSESEGKGGMESGGSFVTFREDGVHGICVGPATRIKAIYASDERQIYPDQEFNSTDEPSGTESDAKDTKTFWLYWGECDQPINTFWASQMDGDGEIGILSRWPHLCYVRWFGRRLGTSPVWPRMTYDVEVRPPNSLAGSSAWMDETASGRGDDGANAAHALMQIATGTFPHGVGMNPAFLDQDKMEALGVLLEEEHLPINIVAHDGIEAAAMIESFLGELGINLVQVGRQIVPVALRPQETSEIPILTDDALGGKLPERDQRQEAERADRVSYAFPDKTRRFTSNPIHVRDDGLARLRGTVDQREVELTSITDMRTARKVVDRLARSSTTDPQRFDFDVMRGGRIITPGTRIIVPDFGTLLVSERIVTSGSPKVKIRCAAESFVGPDSELVFVDVGEGGLPEAVEDIYFRVIERPYAQSGERIELQLLRWRANTRMAKAIVSISANGASYVNEETVGALCGGGTLLEGLAEDALFVLEDGPTFDPGEVVDNDTIQDLTGREELWRAGRQLAYINGEIFFLRGVEVLSESEWRLKGLIRARFDTLPEAHDIGDKVMIVPNDRWIEPIRACYLVPGRTVHVKSLPVMRGAVVDASDVDPIEHVISARAFKPLRPVSFYANATEFTRNTYETGNDLVFTWSYRVRDGGGNAAGEQLAGEPIIATPDPDGPGQLILMEMDNTEIAVIELSKAQVASQSYTYDNATLLADFGSEPSALKARLVQMRDNANGTTVYKSDPVEITIEKV